MIGCSGNGQELAATTSEALEAMSAEEQWEAKVRQPALALREKFELLSDGWSSGLLGVTLSFWLGAL